LSNKIQYFLTVSFVFALLFSVDASGFTIIDSTENNTLPYPYSPNQSSGLFLNTPSNLNLNINYDPQNNYYLFNKRLGEINLNRSQVLDFQRLVVCF